MWLSLLLLLLLLLLTHEQSISFIAVSRLTGE